MNTYPAVRDPGSIELLFRTIRLKQPPEKVTTDYLVSAGFRRQTDVKLLELLFFLGLIDSNLAPSDIWRSATGVEEKEFASVLAVALSTAYSKVFEKYPCGKNIDGKALMTMFKEETGVSDTEAAYMVLTVQVLSDIADFSENTGYATEQPPAVPAPDEETHLPSGTVPDVSDEPAPTISIPEKGVVLNISIPPELIDREMQEILKTLLRKLS